MKLRVSKRAREDLENIWNYTTATWGETQARIYLSQLEEGFNLLLTHPEAGRPAYKIRGGCRTFSKARHLIFYTVSGGYVDILAVLHEQMLPTKNI